jgi:hypothetical protein
MSRLKTSTPDPEIQPAQNQKALYQVARNRKQNQRLAVAQPILRGRHDTRTAMRTLQHLHQQTQHKQLNTINRTTIQIHHHTVLVGQATDHALEVLPNVAMQDHRHISALLLTTQPLL